MKKFLLFVLAVCITDAFAQCTPTISGSTVSCSGGCITLSGGGGMTYTWSANAGSATTSTVTVCPTVNTTYTLYAATGTCTATETIAITVNPLPNITTTSGTICVGSSTCFYVTGGLTYTWSPPSGLNCNTCNGPCATALSTTVYTVVGTDANGCSNYAVATLAVNPAPTVSFTMTPNFMPQVWDVTAAFSGGTTPYTYSWDWGDGSAPSNTAYPSHTYTTAGWYNICATITDVNGCVGTVCQNDSLYRTSSANSMITVNVVSGTTGVKQVKNSSSLSLYPNPASNYVTIQSPTEIGNFAIYNSLGELVLKANSKDKQEKIDFSKLSPGIYIVQVQGKTMKIIKE